LLIDDDKVTLRLLKVKLERGGNALELTRTASEGKAYARQNSPDLILTDALLSDMEGLEVCQQLMQSSQTRHIPVILMSSRGGREVVAALKAGADD
jgi:PleD family two-component response regulator